MEIEVAGSVFDFGFQHCQVEITGVCNMLCEHCRAVYEPKVHMSPSLFKKGIDFATSDACDDFRLTVSGGEPFLHPHLVELLSYAKEKRINDIIITTNGSVITADKLRKLSELGIANLAIQISVDSVYPDKHNKFRNFPNAFERAMRAFDLVKEAGLASSLRASISPDRINEVDDLVKLAIEKGANRIGIGSIIPAGRGKTNANLLMDAEQKKIFLKKIVEAKKKYAYIDVTTEDPIKFALEDCPWDYGEYNISDEAFFGGCTAGISGFNINSEGIITPCAVLLKNIVNLNEVSIEEAKKIYLNSTVIKSLFGRKLQGKCGSCELKRLCGGCRAVSEGASGNYLGTDITCFRTTNLT